MSRHPSGSWLIRRDAGIEKHRLVGAPALASRLALSHHPRPSHYRPFTPAGPQTTHCRTPGVEIDPAGLRPPIHERCRSSRAGSGIADRSRPAAPSASALTQTPVVGHRPLGTTVDKYWYRFTDLALKLLSVYWLCRFTPSWSYRFNCLPLFRKGDSSTQYSTASKLRPLSHLSIPESTPHQLTRAIPSPAERNASQKIAIYRLIVLSGLLGRSPRS